MKCVYLLSSSVYQSVRWCFELLYLTSCSSLLWSVYFGVISYFSPSLPPLSVLYGLRNLFSFLCLKCPAHLLLLFHQTLPLHFTKILVLMFLSSLPHTSSVFYYSPIDTVLYHFFSLKSLLFYFYRYRSPLYLPRLIHMWCTHQLPWIRTYIYPRILLFLWYICVSLCYQIL